jgi:hypothetical protein
MTNEQKAQEWFEEFRPNIVEIDRTAHMIAFAAFCLDKRENETELNKYIQSIRSNFEMWRANQINDVAFTWHLSTNLFKIESIIETLNASKGEM